MTTPTFAVPPKKRGRPPLPQNVGKEPKPKKRRKIGNYVLLQEEMEKKGWISANRAARRMSVAPGTVLYRCKIGDVRFRLEGGNKFFHIGDMTEQFGPTLSAWLVAPSEPKLEFRCPFHPQVRMEFEDTPENLGLLLDETKVVNGTLKCPEAKCLARGIAMAIPFNLYKKFSRI